MGEINRIIRESESKLKFEVERTIVQFRDRVIRQEFLDYIQGKEEELVDYLEAFDAGKIDLQTLVVLSKSLEYSIRAKLSFFEQQKRLRAENLISSIGKIVLNGLANIVKTSLL